MLGKSNPLPNPFEIPIASCDEGKGYYEFHYDLSWSGGLKSAKLRCSSGSEEIDLIEKASSLTDEAKRKIKKVTKRIIQSLGDVKESTPKSRDDLMSMANDASHPVTATILSGLVLLASEISGFGVFALLTTILGTVILTPAGWVFIPALVYVIFAYRKKLKGENLVELKNRIQELDTKLEEGDISKSEHNARRDDLIEEHFAA